MALHHIDHCPLCNHTSFTLMHECIDRLSSGETFQLGKCTNCSFVFTNPRPDNNTLPSYYKSKNYISHSGKPTGPINFLYLQARKFTIQTKTSLIRKLSRKPVLLDYGCGTGELLSACRAKGWNIAGLEPSPEAREKAEQITGIKIASNLQDLGSSRYDIITLWHVLEHIPDFKDKLSNLASLLTSEGKLIIAVPNYESYDAKYYKESWAGFDVPRHLSHFSKTTMTLLVEQHNMKIQAVLPMKLDSYYVSMLSEKYINPDPAGLSNLLRGFIRGYISNRQAKLKMNYSSLIYILTK